MSDNKVAPSFFYYAMVDGTSAVDSVAFGKDLDARGGVTGWRNLLDLLDPDPADASRLVDAAHSFLPIYKLKRAGSIAAEDPKGIAVICPGGLNGFGEDAMWQNFAGGTGIALPEFAASKRRALLYGRHACAELSAKFIMPFMLEPVVEVDGAKKQIVSGSAGAAKGKLFRANMLYLSSHGWLGGFARGDENPDYPAALPLPPTSTGDDPRTAYIPVSAYFVIGKADVDKSSFRGPEWIILAQCSTLNNTTWSMWARLMARSSPGVRGILGYEESSPAAVASIAIADEFFANLKAKKTFYEAWKGANSGQNWAAIVHKDAMKDTLGAWATKPALSGTTISDYLGSASRAPKQVAITDPSPPYGVKVFHSRKGKTVEITPDVLDRVHAELIPEDDYKVEITPTSGTISQVKVQWIHIRDTFTQFNRNAIFSALSATGSGATINTKDPRVLVVDFASPVASTKIGFTAQDAATLLKSGLKAHHSYLWPRIHVTGTGLKNTPFDLKTRGLVYYGV